jgi:hypothetical protein
MFWLSAVLLLLMCMNLPTALLKSTCVHAHNSLLIVSGIYCFHLPCLGFSFRNLLALHRLATLHRDELGQTILIS